MNKQQLASKIWASANKMRSKIEASEYKDYILGFIFYKFLSEKEIKYLENEGWEKEDLKELKEENEDIVNFVSKNVGYFISYDDLFSSWLNNKDFSVANVSEALKNFDRLINPKFKRVFDKIFQTLQSGLSKLGDNSGAQTKAIRGLINLIKDIPMDAKQDYDVLGFIYEYLISNFAANAGKKAGEFYTPYEVSLLMSEIVANHLKGRENIKILDPTSGSGSLLINIGKCVSKHLGNSNNIKYYAQELKENTYNLTRMNLIMRGILPSNIVTRCADTLEDDWPYFDNDSAYSLETVDAVVSNPPYSQSWEPENHKDDIRYARFGLAPKSKADYAFLLHDLYHVKEDGIMTIVLPHGVLFRGGEEETIRTALIENNHIDAIIGLPANIFFGTGIPTIIMVLRQKRENDDVLIIDASKNFIKSGKNNKLQASDIKRILDTVIARKDRPKFAKVVSKADIVANGYNLNIPRYVDSSEKTESYDIYATMNGGIPNKEIDELNKYFEMFPSLRNELFSAINKNYSEIKNINLEETVKNNSDVKSFIIKYENVFSSFKQYLYDRLISNLNNFDIHSEESIIADELLVRLNNFEIVDFYNAYQSLDNTYKIISQDSELIKTEGIESLTIVDPIMITKEKNGEEIEVQEGYAGRILPYELIQNTLLVSEKEYIESLNLNLSDIQSQLDELLESIDEDDKESNASLFSEEGDSFVSKEITKFVKPLVKNISKYEKDSFEYKIYSVSKLFESEKSINKLIKEKNQELLNKCKSTIENLTQSEAIELLSNKWIDPIIDFINDIPSTIIKDLIKKVNSLSEKYEVTLTDLDLEICSVEKDLASLLDELVGDEFDMKGIASFKKLLVGEENE